VNGFVKDSGKTIEFDEAGRILFRVAGLSSTQYIRALSSGEAQIFVLLTHLMFNPAAQRANVFIIDEPELSLHIEWQELFIESIEASNTTIQFILATHSPSIMLDRIDSCVEVVPKRFGKVAQ
jgi:predicted ATP-binding protein involved in virulence